MIETDVLVGVLTCLDVYVGFEDQNLVKNKQKISKKWPIWPPKFQKANFNTLKLYWDIPNDSLKVINDGNWSANVCFDMFRWLSWSEEAKIGHK